MSAADRRYRAAVRELAHDVGTWQRLRLAHVADADGLCVARGCGMPGSGTPVAAHPCSVRRLADAAERVHRRRP